jgi:hypothetical protein
MRINSLGGKQLKLLIAGFILVSGVAVPAATATDDTSGLWRERLSKPAAWCSGILSPGSAEVEGGEGLPGTTASFRFTKYGEYAYLQESDTTEEEHQGNYRIQSSRTDVGTLILGSGSYLSIKFDGKVLNILGYGGNYSQCPSHVTAPIEAIEAWDGLKSTKVLPIVKGLTRAPLRRSNTFDSYRKAGAFNFTSDGRFTAEYRNGTCKTNGRWSVRSDPGHGAQRYELSTGSTATCDPELRTLGKPDGTEKFESRFIIQTASDGSIMLDDWYNPKPSPTIQRARQSIGYYGDFEVGLEVPQVLLGKPSSGTIALVNRADRNTGSPAKPLIVRSVKITTVPNTWGNAGQTSNRKVVANVAFGDQLLQPGTKTSKTVEMKWPSKELPKGSDYTVQIELTYVDAKVITSYANLTLGGRRDPTDQGPIAK